ncbi:hypothetical protein HMPREF9441_00322 [Paraprevotella clara YIT 11840]|uniref:Uncharacterized protein n=1 Tax=Paraprevotella clara YIT 11840 TaxID=762968 RepID=G5SLV0_9BACT|nr:hypothetical protein HMPREF9441_00322 [Paraprevotella clara YIT 11840]
MLRYNSHRASERKQKKKTNDITSKGKPPWLAYSQAKPYPE